jgi:hypothetical protein
MDGGKQKKGTRNVLGLKSEDVITVTVTHQGLPPLNMETLFRPSYQSGNEQSQKEKIAAVTHQKVDL